MNKAGSFHVLDANAGKTLLNQTLQFPRPDGFNVYPSLCLAKKQLFASNDAGNTLLLEPDDRGTVSGSNTLLYGSGATPVFSGQRLFVRGGRRIGGRRITDCKTGANSALKSSGI